MAEVNRRLEVAKEKLKAVKEVEARADAIEKELAAEEDAKKKEIEEKLKVGDEREDALVASEVGDEEIINDGGVSDSDEEFDLVIETCRVDLPPGWDEDKTGNGANERPREFFVTSIEDNKMSWIPANIDEIRSFLKSHK